MSRELWVSAVDVAEATEGVISVGHLGLPNGLDAEERIEFNVKALNGGLVRFGGFEAVRLSGVSGEIDQYDHTIDGADSSGTATMTGIMSATKAQSGIYKSEPDDERNIRHLRNGVVSLEWNTDVLAQRAKVGKNGENLEFDLNHRASQINNTVKRSAIKAAWRHNVDEVFEAHDIDRKVIGSMIEVLYCAVAAVPIFENPNLAGVSKAAIVRTVISYVEYACVHFRDKSREGLFDPSSTIIRPTRAAIASGVLATNRLVRYGKSE